jgi:hypothetical protein
MLDELLQLLPRIKVEALEWRSRAVDFLVATQGVDHVLSAADRIGPVLVARKGVVQHKIQIHLVKDSFFSIA